MNNENNQQNTNVPNPFASLGPSEPMNKNINQQSPINNMNMPNQVAGPQSNYGNPGFNNQFNNPQQSMPNNMQYNQPMISNNNIDPNIPNMPKMPNIPNNNVQPNQPSIPNMPNNNVQPNMQVTSMLMQPNQEPVTLQHNEEPVNKPIETGPTAPTQGGNIQIKKKKSKTKLVKILLYIFFIGLIIASGVVFYLDYTSEPEEPEIYDQLPSEIVVEEKDKINTQVDDFTLALAPDVDFNHEREYYNNPEIIGRLEIPGLFNVLVAKTDNNSFYLSHDIYRKQDIRGTEFLDYRVAPTSKQVNIYGHNTRDINIKVAFLKLEQFLNKDFFDANQYIIFQYDGGKAAYKIIAIKEIRKNNLEHMYVDKVGADFVAHVQNMTTGEGVVNSRDLPYDENSNIIVLQTCSHHWDDAFYTVIGVKVRDL